MTQATYRRTVEQLETVASKFWPQELSRQEAELSIIPILIKTQEDFISILKVPVADLEGMLQILDTSTLSPNLFLKHLVVLADFGGEPLKRVSAEYERLFPNNALTYLWTVGSETHERTYSFRAFPNKKFSNPTLGLDGKRLLENNPLTDLQRDAIAMLLFGAASTNEDTADVLVQCEISNYLGQPDKLDKFIRERYIWVSRITGGSKSNSLGQLAQQFVKKYLEEHLGVPETHIASNGHIPGVRHVGETDSRLTTFDLVVKNGEKYVAVEVSFQVTTNSVIERKSGQAQARYRQIEDNGYRIAYVLDGAGNFERDSALRTICAFSHCTVAFSQAELEVLCQFIREYFANG